MTVPKDNTVRDTAFMVDMLTAVSREAASVAKLKACQTLHTNNNVDNGATVRPGK